MKNFSTSPGEARITGSSKISVACFMIILFVAFSLTTFAQTQQSAGQTAGIKNQFTPIPPVSQQEIESVPAEKKDAPATNDALIEGPSLNGALINVKDEKQYFEQKKKEQEKNIKSEKEVNTPK